MKKFLKMMLVMSLVALALSGCNVFGNDDDDDDDTNKAPAELQGTWVSIENSSTEFLQISQSSAISNTIKTKDGNEVPFLEKATVTVSYDNSSSPKSFTISNPEIKVKVAANSDWETIDPEFTSQTLEYSISGDELTITDEDEDKTVYTKAEEYSSSDLSGEWKKIYTDSSITLNFSGSIGTRTEIRTGGFPYGEKYTVSLTYDSENTPKAYTLDLTAVEIQATQGASWTDGTVPSGFTPVTQYYFISGDELTVYDDENGAITFTKQ